MLVTAWLAIGAIGLASTSAAGYFALRMTPEEDATVIAAGTLGFLAWGVWSYGAFNIHYPIDGSPSLAFTEPTVALVGLGCAVLSGFLALTGPIEAIGRVQDTRMEDV